MPRPRHAREVLDKTRCVCSAGGSSSSSAGNVSGTFSGPVSREILCARGFLQRRERTWRMGAATVIVTGDTAALSPTRPGGRLDVAPGWRNR